MSTLFKASLLLGCLLWQSSGLASDTGWLTSPQNDHAKVRLQADRSAPDHTRILLEVALESGWKTYWRSPGEGGIAPQILWNQPVGDFQWHWPTPRPFEVAGLSTQGYQQQVRFPLSLDYPAGSRSRHLAPLHLQQRLHPDRLPLHPGGGWAGAGRFRLRLGPDHEHPAADAACRHPGRARLPAQPAATARRAGRGLAGTCALHRCAGGAEFGKPALEVSGNTLIARVPVSDGWQGDALTCVANPSACCSAAAMRPGRPAPPSPIPSPAGPRPASHLAAGAALLGGLILNLMPCVLPVLALKLGTVLQQQESKQRQVRKQFLAASAGIIASFWVLAAMSSLLRATQGRSAGGSSSRAPVSSASWCGDPAVLRQPAGAVRNPLAQQSQHSPRHQRRQGARRPLPAGELCHPAGHPCSAPFLGTAVAFALAAPLGQLWLIFTALGLGMSLPWLLVAALPRLALWLPKPGHWMGRLRILLGLMMLGSSLWLASLLGNHLGSTATGWLMAAMLLALLIGILWRYGMRGFTLALSLSALIGGALLLGAPSRRRGRVASIALPGSRSPNRPSSMRWPSASGSSSTSPPTGASPARPTSTTCCCVMRCRASCRPPTWWPCAATGAGRAMPSPPSCASAARPPSPSTRSTGPACQRERSSRPAGQGRLARRVAPGRPRPGRCPPFLRRIP